MVDRKLQASPQSPPRPCQLAKAATTKVKSPASRRLEFDELAGGQRPAQTVHREIVVSGKENRPAGLCVCSCNCICQPSIANASVVGISAGPRGLSTSHYTLFCC